MTKAELQQLADEQAAKIRQQAQTIKSFKSRIEHLMRSEYQREYARRIRQPRCGAAV